MKPGFVPLVLGLAGFSAPLARAETNAKGHSRPADERQVAEASAAVELVKGFILAGESNDAAARASYLAPTIFFYGHRRTAAEATKEIARLYRRWPKRKFALTPDLEVFAIPHHPRAFRIVALLEYELFDQANERMSGQSRMTCIVQLDRGSARVVGVDEKLLPGTTSVYEGR